jgi:hypothetical protein
VIRKDTIRDAFNGSKRRNVLIKESKDWQLLCSSMDVLEDTELCIDSYKKLDVEKYNNKGLCYLIVYGILQTLILQQDALENIKNVLGYKINVPDEIKNIREIRNNAVGHPIRERNGEINSINFLVRMTLHPFKFQINTWKPEYDDVWHTSECIDILAIIESQTKYIETVKADIIMRIKKEDRSPSVEAKKEL